MAGESPDKSEQRKSSGETTPGERDPRLAVFRQAPASAGAAPGVAPGVDQPTAVFKMPPEASAKQSTPSAVEPGTETGSVENDTRLRAAVAAWVASADDDAPAPEGQDEAASAEAVPAEAVPAPAEADSGEQVEPEAEAARDEPGSATPAEHDEDAPAPADEAAEAAEDSAPEAEVDGDAADASSDAEGVSAGAEPHGEDTSPEAAASGPAKISGDRTPAAADEAAEAAADSAPEAEAEAEAEADAAPAGDRAGSATSADATAASGDEPGSGTPAKPASPDAERDTESPDAEGSPSPTPSTESASASAAEADADADEAPGDGHTAPASDKSAESAEAKAADQTEAAPDAPRGKPVDRPTAVFKAPPRPVVDQATTALKVPPAPRSQPAGEAARSSTFVPLRADDAPAPAASKPQAVAPAAPSAPPALTPASLTEAERTKQQPMPPLPPLDLLAELTNTPPPRQTPVRTVVRRVKIWTPLAVLLLIVFAVVQAVRPLPEPSLELSAEPTFTFKGGQLSLPWPDEGQGAVEVEGVGSIGEYGAQKPAPLASVAKTMTAYVILRDHPIKGEETGPKITVDQQAEDESKIEEESTAQISKGQQFTEEQMLQLLMIPSGNNAARLLARWDAKTEAEFVKKMNDAAKDLGMTDTTYTDPSGLKSTTVSTPKDQLKLAKAVMQNDVFRDIVNTTITTIPGIDRQIRNNNDKALLLEGVGGIKTGSSTPAGGNLLWSANALVDGQIRRIVGITMGAQKAAILNDKLELAIDYSIKVIQAAQAGVTSTTVVKKGDVVGHVDDGLGGRTAVVATKDLKAVGWAGLKVEIAINDGGKVLPHSASAGDIVGQVSIGSGTGKVSAPVALQQDLAEPGFGAKITRLG
ncbi:serine hydrolase [Streptomyces lunaelactis]|nr:serine hydrolase [Streptomyces lunaelactis]